MKYEVEITETLQRVVEFVGVGLQGVDEPGFGPKCQCAESAEVERGDCVRARHGRCENRSGSCENRY